MPRAVQVRLGPLASIIVAIWSSRGIFRMSRIGLKALAGA